MADLLRMALQLGLVAWVCFSLGAWIGRRLNRRGSNPPPPLQGPPPAPGPPRPTGGRMIRLDQDPGPPPDDTARRLRDLEARVDLLEALSRRLSTELNRRHD